MDEKDFDKYLTGRYKEQADWYDKRAQTNQEKYRWMQWSIIITEADKSGEPPPASNTN
jgi:hypothetical protein